MMLPEEIRDQIRDRLWDTAEKIGWSELSDMERSRYYEKWTRDPALGGKLGHFMDPRKVRVYIKDSLLKPYERSRPFITEEEVLKRLRIAKPPKVVEEYIKPYGRRFIDGRIICWGKSRDWKLILMAAFERSQRVSDGRPFGALLLETGKTSEASMRLVVNEAAKRLGLEMIEWID